MAETPVLETGSSNHPISGPCLVRLNLIRDPEAHAHAKLKADPRHPVLSKDWIIMGHAVKASFQPFAH